MHCDTGSYGAKGQLSGDTPLILAHFSCVANGSARTNTNPQTQSRIPGGRPEASCKLVIFQCNDEQFKQKKQVNRKHGIISNVPHRRSRDLCCLDLGLSGPVHGASVWNDVEGQTGDCGCQVSITSEGTEAPVCHLRRDTTPKTPHPLSLHFILLTGKMCWKLCGHCERNWLNCDHFGGGLQLFYTNLIS